jgi:hypothetical protein
MSEPVRRLDEIKVETLRVWGEGLQSDARDEVRAAGRAITMLVEEVERLNIDLWHARADARDAREGWERAVPEPAVPDTHALQEPADRREPAEVEPVSSPRLALPPPLPAY